MITAATDTSHTSYSLVGSSDWFERIQSEIRRVAPYRSSVLITGPSGTGKELIARAIHDEGPRHSEPFVAVNCAAISPTLFESQMFGHVKGAFTGAHCASSGWFRAAEGGTLFLDEVAELDREFQAKLLRVLQERRVVPVGSHQEHEIDVRIVAATNRDLMREVVERRFREDLYYRLAVVSLRTVPLCDRPDDLDVLAHFLLAQVCTGQGIPFKPLMPAALLKLRRHDWPGNVRELRNVLERAVMLTPGNLIGGDDIVWDNSPAEAASGGPDESACVPRSSGAAQGDLDKRCWPSMADIERWHIETTLEHTDFNQARAAQLLELHRNVLRSRIKKYGLDTSRSTPGRPPK